MLLIVIPFILFMAIIVVVLINLVDYFSRVERGYPTVCTVEVVYEGDFSDAARRSLDRQVSDRLCEHFEEQSLQIVLVEEGIVNVSVDVPNWFLEYTFVRKGEDWRIKKYARTFNSNE
jgi:hypothetical protein